MKAAGGHDPVAAISEAEATGEVAETFADIRQTMQIPLITSIWRTLVPVEGGLAAAWDSTRPLYVTGQPAAALRSLVERADLPEPEPLEPGRLEAAGVSAEDCPAIRAILDAYNRSNGMNFLALTALIAVPAGAAPERPVPPPPGRWPELPPLLDRADIAPANWELLLELNRFGATPGESGPATLWRHLAHWPGLLALMRDGLGPLQRDGRIDRAIQGIMEIAAGEGARLARLRPDPVELPPDAHAMIASYVTNPGLVARMVTLGHGLAGWLERA